jgi:hypothetical protein
MTNIIKNISNSKELTILKQRIITKEENSPEMFFKLENLQ